MTDIKKICGLPKNPRFGGNDEIQKDAKYVLKQQLEGLQYPTQMEFTKDMRDSKVLLQSAKDSWSSSTASSSNLQNIAFVSENNQLTNELRLNEYDLEEMDLKWQVALISLRINKFQKEDLEKLTVFDAKDLESEGEELAIEIESINWKERRIRSIIDSFFFFFDGECVDWTTHSEDKITYAFMANKHHRINHSAQKEKDDLDVHRTLEVEIDDSQYTYGPEKTQPTEPDSQTNEVDACDSNISTETSELVFEPVVNESHVEVQPKVWSDAPIIEGVKAVVTVGKNGSLLLRSPQQVVNEQTGIQTIVSSPNTMVDLEP
ncbi:hypothetical protein Tco_0800425 [Tanacetum coccineum]|uniref:Uncharacterized protein n=1 Tax=Tanacetum coccineum TaxID=301880 RepID=A0ABQ4ZWD8_9ASTR